MKCINHPERLAEYTCRGCGKPFCSECIKIIDNEPFCKKCAQAMLEKRMETRTQPIVNQGTEKKTIPKKIKTKKVGLIIMSILLASAIIGYVVHSELSKRAFQKEIEAFQKQKAASQKQTQEEYYKVARRIAYNLKIECNFRYTEAKKFLNEALKINPEYKEARELLANIYRWESERTGNKAALEKSITLLENQLKATPQDPDTHYLLALSYEDKGLYDKALFHLDKALNLCGTEPKRVSRRICCHNVIGHIYKEKGQYKKAIREYKKVINLNPDSDGPYSNIAKIYRENLKDFDKAQEWYDKAKNVRASKKKG